MIFTSYFDEADTHGPAPTVMSGNAYQWRRFDKKIRRLQEEYAFTIFHATAFKSRQDEFENWTDDQCLYWSASLGQNVGSKSNGKSDRFSRPVIIMRKLAHGFYLVAPPRPESRRGR